MPQVEPTFSFVGFFTIIYIIAVLCLAVASVIALAILYKHAEKPTVARSITTAYISLFVLVVLISLWTIYTR